ncbi:MAG: hypothetical protein ACKO5E_13360 [bacterium]
MTQPSTGKNSSETQSSPDSWPAWRIRLARLSPYTLEVQEQLDRLYQLTILLTVVPSVMALIIFSLFTVFGRPDIGIIAITVIFGPMIAIAWRDYRRIARQARQYLASASKNHDKPDN